MKNVYNLVSYAGKAHISKLVNNLLHGANTSAAKRGYNNIIVVLHPVYIVVCFFFTHAPYRYLLIRRMDYKTGCVNSGASQG